MTYSLQITLLNRDKGYIFSEFTEPLDDDYTHEDGSLDIGAIFRTARAEYGRCESKVYVDGPPTRSVGWVFAKRLQYEDCADHYTREAWVSVVEVEPATARYVGIEGGESS